MDTNTRTIAHCERSSERATCIISYATSTGTSQETATITCRTIQDRLSQLSRLQGTHGVSVDSIFAIQIAFSGPRGKCSLPDTRRCSAWSKDQQGCFPGIKRPSDLEWSSEFDAKRRKRGQGTTDKVMSNHLAAGRDQGSPDTNWNGEQQRSEASGTESSASYQSSLPSGDLQQTSDDDSQISATRAVEALSISASPSSAGSRSEASPQRTQSVHPESPDRPVTTSTRRVRGREYSLKIVSLPVQCTTTGHSLCEPPLIAQLVVRSTNEPDGVDVLAEEDLPYLIANVSLWNAEGTTQVFPQPDLTVSSPLRGDLVASGQIYRDTDGNERIFFVFKSLQILRPGRWKLGVSLIAIWPEPNSQNTDAGTVLVGIKSSTSTVAVPEDSPLTASNIQIDRDTRELLETLRDQGADISGSERDSVDSRD